MNLHIGWPQGMYIGLLIFRYGYATLKAHNNGDGPAINITTSVMAVAAETSLLWWGGFFG